MMKQAANQVTRQHQAGFTLLEILVAISIFTLIGIASNSVLTRVLDGDAISQQRFQQLQRLQRVMLTIERDFMQAANRPVRVEGATNNVVMSGGANLFESEADGVGFVRAGWMNPQLILPRSNMQAVAYRLFEGRLEKLYSNYVDNVVGAEPKVKVLLEDVLDFQVTFYLGPKQDAEDNSNWGDVYTGADLPEAIEVTISTDNFGTIKRKFLMAKGGAP